MIVRIKYDPVPLHLVRKPMGMKTRLVSGENILLYKQSKLVKRLGLFPVGFLCGAFCGEVRLIRQ